MRLTRPSPAKPNRRTVPVLDGRPDEQGKDGCQPTVNRREMLRRRRPHAKRRDHIDACHHRTRDGCRLGADSLPEILFVAPSLEVTSTRKSPHEGS